VSEPVTWTIPQLTNWVNAVISETLGGEIWIEGEISNLQRSSAGHVYFSLSEPGENNRQPSHTLAVTLFEWHRQNVNRHLKRSGGGVRMSDGVRVRIRGAIEIYGPRSQLQLKMSGIDPVFTLGNLAAERDRLLATLRAEGLLETNKALALHPLPLRIGLITSLGSAAHADFMAEFTGSDLAFDVVAIDARVQGAEAVPTVIAAIGAAAASGVDLIALVRGGGARTDLVAFDHELIARAIATSTVPVWTGLGHEIDRSVADEVAHRSLKTPTACAAAIIERVNSGAQMIEQLWDAICDTASARLDRGDVTLERLASRIARSSVGGLDRASTRLATSSHQVRRFTDFHLIRSSARLDAALASVAAVAPRRIAEGERRLDAIASTVRAYDPAIALARGWSITRTTDGRVARAGDVAVGAELVTTLIDGAVLSTATGTVTDL